MYAAKGADEWKEEKGQEGRLYMNVANAMWHCAYIEPCFVKQDYVLAYKRLLDQPTER